MRKSFLSEVNITNKTRNSMKLSLASGKPAVETVVSAEAMEAATEGYFEAKETLAQIALENLELGQVISNIDFCVTALQKSDDPEKTVEVLDLVSSCEGLIETVDGKLTAQAAIEGLGDVMKGAWEKIKEFFAKLAEMAKKLYRSITEGASAKKVEEESAVAENAPDGIAKEKFDAERAMVTQKQFEEREKAMEAYVKDIQGSNKDISEMLVKLSAAKDDKAAAELVAKLNGVLEKSEQSDAKYDEFCKKLDQVVSNTKAYSLEEAGWGDLKIRDIGKKIKYLWNKGPCAAEIKTLEKLIDEANKAIKQFDGQEFIDQKTRREIIKAANKSIHVYNRRLTYLVNHNKWYWKVLWVITGSCRIVGRKSWELTKSGANWTWKKITRK